jgi:hypothetical protein
MAMPSNDIVQARVRSQGTPKRYMGRYTTRAIRYSQAPAGGNGSRDFGYLDHDQKPKRPGSGLPKVVVSPSRSTKINIVCRPE